MLDTCVSRPEAPCFHESFLFAAGETRSGTVELDLYQPDGALSIVTLSDFTSWRRVVDSPRKGRAFRARRGTAAALIDCVTREAHCLTVHCYGLALRFFGRDVQVKLDFIARVEPPQLFGLVRGNLYRGKYGSRFTEHRKGTR